MGNDLPNFRFISGATVSQILLRRLGQVQELIRAAYISHERGETVLPHSLFLVPNSQLSNRIIALPAYIETSDVLGMKWVASFPANVDRGYARSNSVIILNDSSTGHPVACIEGSTINLLRTAMSAIVCSEALLRKKRIRNLGIVGTGELTKMFCRLLSACEWQVDNFTLHDVREEKAEELAIEVQNQFSSSVVRVGDLARALATSDVLLFATTASSPYVTDLSMLSLNPLILHLSLRDLGAQVIWASENVVDDAAHVMRESTSLDLASRSSNSALTTTSIGQLLLGQAHLVMGKPVVVSPFGLGILDVALASLALSIATAEGTALTVPDFFSKVIPPLSTTDGGNGDAGEPP